MSRALRATRRSAVKTRSQPANQLQSLRVTAPDASRHRLGELSTKELVAVAACFRPSNDMDDVQTATGFALRSVARRHEVFLEEIGAAG